MPGNSERQNRKRNISPSAHYSNNSSNGRFQQQNSLFYGDYSKSDQSYHSNSKKKTYHSPINNSISNKVLKLSNSYQENAQQQNNVLYFNLILY